jgi:mannan endo-1,4-beta-mannosidase
MRITVMLAVFGASALSLFAVEAPLQNFITARDGRLFDGDQEFRFISWNIPNLLIVEDNFAWNAPNDWLLPDEFELTDAFATVSQLGGTVVRSYSIPIQRADEDTSVPKYVRALGKYNEDGFRTMDLALKLANEHHIRLIIPLINNWPWQGGREEFAAWRGKPKNAFWTDPQLIADYEDMVRYVLTRTNTLTGVRYCDDKAILCWETGNELRGPSSWTKTVAGFIKSVDTNHLVMDGFDGGIRADILDCPAVDIVTTHHYPSSRDPRTMAQQIRDDAKLVAGKKAYIIGEFGFVSTDEMRDAMQAIMDSPVSGGLLWSLRFRNRTGGFYWHSEPDGADLYKAFHWPGSVMGNAYDEINLLKIVRADAFAIRSLPEPPVPVPAPPTLLPITDAAAISWQGSVGAKRYQVERAAETDGDLSQPGGGAHPIGGHWQIVSSNVDEAFTQYRPQFADENVPAGRWYYRVRAGNDAGWSEPSNVVGPVVVTHATLVDELADFSKTSAHSGTIRLETHDSRQAKEDATRVAGNAGDSLTYQLLAAVEGFRVFVFFPKAVADLEFSISADGKTFQPVKADRQDSVVGANDYGYWKPAIFHVENINGDATFLKIKLTGETQISRVEITHKLDHN